MAVQIRGQVYYRVSVPILPGKELLTFYGQDYSSDLGILPKKFKEEEGHRRVLSLEDVTPDKFCEFKVLNLLNEKRKPKQTKPPRLVHIPDILYFY